MTTKSFKSGFITGAVVGAVTGMLVDPMKDKQSTKLQKNASHVFKSIGAVLDNFMELRK